MKTDQTQSFIDVECSTPNSEFQLNNCESGDHCDMESHDISFEGEEYMTPITPEGKQRQEDKVPLKQIATLEPHRSSPNSYGVLLGEEQVGEGFATFHGTPHAESMRGALKPREPFANVSQPQPACGKIDIHHRHLKKCNSRNLTNMMRIWSKNLSSRNFKEAGRYKIQTKRSFSLLLPRLRRVAAALETREIMMEFPCANPALPTVGSPSNTDKNCNGEIVNLNQGVTSSGGNDKFINYSDKRVKQWASLKTRLSRIIHYLEKSELCHHETKTEKPNSTLTDLPGCSQMSCTAQTPELETIDDMKNAQNTCSDSTASGNDDGNTNLVAGYIFPMDMNIEIENDPLGNWVELRKNIVSLTSSCSSNSAS